MSKTRGELRDDRNSLILECHRLKAQRDALLAAAKLVVRAADCMEISVAGNIDKLRAACQEAEKP